MVKVNNKCMKLKLVCIKVAIGKIILTLQGHVPFDTRLIEDTLVLI